MFGRLYEEWTRDSDFRPVGEEFWAAKARSFEGRIGLSEFERAVFERLQEKLEGCLSVLDVGCGSGTMLGLLKDIPRRVGLEPSSDMRTVAHRKLADEVKSGAVSIMDYYWEDNWDAVPMTDAVISIRSIQTLNVQNVVNKMLEKARKVCIIVTRWGSHLLQELLDLVPFNVKGLPPISLLTGMFEEAGYFPEVEYISTSKEINIGTDFERDVVSKDIIRRINGVNWDEIMINKLKENWWGR